MAKSDGESLGEQMRREARDARDAAYDIEPLFVQRWSPRAMSGEALREPEFMPLFEAARWAPSSYNNQPWRFLYATPESDEWDLFLDLLVEGNREWAEDAGVLVVIVSKTTFDHNGEYAPTHSFDAGAAAENLALEAARRGLVAHGMQGFDYDRAAAELDVPDEFEVEAMYAVGRPAPEETLPEELREREKPSGRKSLEEVTSEGGFGDGE